jgi:hypothetical protein
MLRFFTLLLIVFSACFDVEAQSIDYFANQPRWRVNSSCASPYPCIVTVDQEYFLGPDTLIGSNTYKVVYKQGYVSYLYMSTPPVPPNCTGSYSFVNNTVAEAWIRQLGKKMMIWIPSFQTEELLYDFDLSVGDTVPNSYNNFLGGTDTVVSVDSILLRGQYRRVMLTSEGLELIEGVGSDRGLLEPMDLIFDCGYQRTCFSLADTTWLPGQGTNCQLILTDSQKSKSQESSLILHSSSQGFAMDLPPRTGDCKYSVFNLSGKLIFCGILNPGFNTINYPSKLCSGVYLLQLSARNYTTVRKIVVLE